MGKVKGRKRHILTDTDGNLVHAVVHTADIHDRDGAPLVLGEIVRRFPRLRHVFVDGGYAETSSGMPCAGSESKSSRSLNGPILARVRGSAPTLGRRTNARLG